MKSYEVNFNKSGDCREGNLMSDFSCPWDAEPVPDTRFRAVWNESRFFFSFVVEDQDLVLPEDSDSGQAALGSDRVELFFATSLDLSTPYYGAEMAPNGNVYDYRASYYREVEDNWSFQTLHFEGVETEGGYRVDGNLEIQELEDLLCFVERRMVTGVYRADFSHGQEGEIDHRWIPWVDPKTEKPDFHVPSSFGTFYFQEPI